MLMHDPLKERVEVKKAAIGTVVVGNEPLVRGRAGSFPRRKQNEAKLVRYDHSISLICADTDELVAARLCLIPPICSAITQSLSPAPAILHHDCVRTVPSRPDAH